MNAGLLLAFGLGFLLGIEFGRVLTKIKVAMNFEKKKKGVRKCRTSY